MSKYGEPWSAASVGENVCDIHESEKPGCPSLIAEDVDGDHADRIVRCVNALSGFNPEAVRELVEAVARRETILRAHYEVTVSPLRKSDDVSGMVALYAQFREADAMVCAALAKVRGS